MTTQPDSTTNPNAVQASAQLSPHHREMLRTASAISDAVIAARGYRTITDKTELGALGFASAQCRAGLVIPLHGVNGSNGVYVLRPDAPRSLDDKRKGKLADGTYPQKVLKYEYPKGQQTHLDVPPACRPNIGNPAVPLWITEGQKKADALASQDLCALALLGVWNWRGRNDLGGLTALADWDSVALNDREVRIVFDSDLTRNPQVQNALGRLKKFLANKGAHVTVVYLPPTPDGSKQGVDDFFAAGHTRPDLEALVEAPRPAPQPVAPLVELLDAAPGTISKPLTLLEGHAFAAAWLHARVTITESLNRAGEVTRHNPPIVKTERRLFVVRDDGRVFGDGGDAGLDDLGAEVHLPEIPPGDKLWSSQGLQTYRRGERPDPADVFNRTVEVILTFIDFKHSLADQRTMAELVACYVLATWFLDAFTVIGFLWPNGDRGCGKTQLLAVVCEVAYLGQVILAGGSFASLRDMADYGATMAFDDAENLSDPRKTDPDKRALLLAGNRKGNTVPVKELSGDKTWRTRYVNTYCPRLFSAIQAPDAVLASRSIVIPLIRTADRAKANADPLEYDLWPHDRRRLLDDLWALGVAHLAQLPGYARRVSARANLMGRNLEPWRPILAVALWLDEHGVPGLFTRLEQLSQAYQNERPDFETGDLTVPVIRAVCAKWANRANCAKSWGDTLSCTAAELVAEIDQLIKDDELPNLTAGSVSAQRVGVVLSKRRLKKPPRSGGKGPRVWEISAADLRDWCVSYGVPVPDGMPATTPDDDDVATGANPDDADPTMPLWATGDDPTRDDVADPDDDETMIIDDAGATPPSPQVGPLGPTWHLAQADEEYEEFEL